MAEEALGKKKPLIDRDILILAGLLLLLPWVLPFKSLPAEILIYALGSVAFNILLGYTGLLSFGQAAFFGGGAYLTGLFLIHFGWHPGGGRTRKGMNARLVHSVPGRTDEDR